MNIKKITAFAAALALALSLSACNSDGGTTAGADVSTTAKAETVNDETTTAKDENGKDNSEETTVPEETTTEETTTEPVVEASPVEDFEYEEAGGEITITEYKGSEAEVIIPAEIDGKPVTTIGANAFEGSSITSIVIPEGVKTIEFRAFYECGKLEDISLPESITNMVRSSYIYDTGEAWSPFSDTPWLKSKREENPLVIVNNIVVDGQTCKRDVEIPDGVRVIAGGAFSGCTTVTSVKLPDSLETVGDYAFTNCDRLTEIVLPDNINYIGSSAFDRCKALENVTFPNSTVEMDGDIFGRFNEHATPWLEKKISENPLVIVNGNLINGQNCTGDVVIPDSVKSISGCAFYGAEITGAHLPDGITKIPDGLFSGCSKLTSVNIPDSVTEIGYSAFGGISLKSVNIPDSVTEIDEYAFGYCGNLESITLPKGITKINAWTFSGCESLTSITIPDGVTEIGDYAFYECNSLKNVTLSESLKKIGSKAFYDDRNIKELTLPDSLESIATDALEGCKFDITYKGEIYFPELYNELYEAINGQ